MKILVVDDSTTMRRILINCLKKIGFEDIVQAGDGLEAQNVLKEHPDVGLALVDWNMPNMNGFEFLEATKADDEFKHIPMIMVTTEAEKKNVVLAIKAGAANYVIKPFTEDVIRDKIGAVVALDD
ncbi:MAG: two-component system response regulator [Planctomycetota bacterium]|nr:MAG: two-component system response regulator [Planctomycetota bacterium]